ncbi:hypothetical protein [Mesorhizobium sp. Root552]|uniref:hypothetical protein n=1 Tax=Mesorhizobium sp. Root552 TaxID=1736555 RepID=UPI0012E9512D|nr:hypothetical protein [Mesorhizobium sp. Root552]
MSHQYSIADLQGRSLPELQRLQHQVQSALAQTQPGTEARRQAIASLEAIRRMIRQKQQAMAPRF